MQLGVIGTALEEQAEKDALVDFFVHTLLPLEVTTKKIADLIVVELERQLLIGPGESFQNLSAKNKVDLEAIYKWMDKTFGEGWRKND